MTRSRGAEPGGVKSPGLEAGVLPAVFDPGAAIFLCSGEGRGEVHAENDEWCEGCELRV